MDDFEMGTHKIIKPQQVDDTEVNEPELIDEVDLLEELLAESEADRPAPPPEVSRLVLTPDPYASSLKLTDYRHPPNMSSFRRIAALFYEVWFTIPKRDHRIILFFNDPDGLREPDSVDMHMSLTDEKIEPEDRKKFDESIEAISVPAIFADTSFPIWSIGTFTTLITLNAPAMDRMPDYCVKWVLATQLGHASLADGLHDYNDGNLAVALAQKWGFGWKRWASWKSKHMDEYVDEQMDMWV